MRLCRLLPALLIAAAVAGCAGVPGFPIAAAPPPDAPPPPADLDMLAYGRPVAYREPVAVPLPAPLPVPAAVLPGPAPGGLEPYTLDSGDRLRIVVFGQEGLTSTYIVDVSGKIAMPLIGAVSVRGLTTTQAARVIADRLRQGFIREPHVAIEVEIYRPFFILGEVIAPGQYPYVPNMTVETAVALAGGFTPRAYRWDVEVSRSAGGVTARQKVPMIAPVRPGDTINVGERWF
ncbi:MAG: polysaccharide biosynthesis/export family protein [Xanthobacteraceae bacterium]|jgi:polysaccharide biosynthesis/export protein